MKPSGFYVDPLFSKVVFLYCVAKENNDLLLYFCACGENVGKNQAKKRISD